MADNRIRHLREGRGWSIRDLAERAGIDFNTVHRLETGATRLDVEKMRRISKPLGVKPSALLLDEDVEFRVDEDGERLIAELGEIPSEDRPDVLYAAREMVRVARGMAAQAAAMALGQDRAEVAGLADIWGRFDNDQRNQAMKVLRAMSEG